MVTDTAQKNRVLRLAQWLTENTHDANSTINEWQCSYRTNEMTRDALGDLVFCINERQGGDQDDYERLMEVAILAAYTLAANVMVYSEANAEYCPVCED